MRRLRRSIERSTARRIKDRLVASTMGVGLVLASSSVFAQSPPPPAPEPAPAPSTTEDVELPGLDVQGQRQLDYKAIQSDNDKLPNLLKDTPQSITVVPQRIIREEAVFSLRDALRNVTGISLAAGEGGGAQGDNLTLRGFSARNDIFTDGVRDFGQYTRDVFDLDSVEVLKGPSSVLFGRGSTGGVINQVTKMPKLTPSYTFTGTEGTGPFSRAAVDMNQPVADTAAFRLNGMFTDAGVVDRDETHLRRWGAAPSFTVGLGTPTQFSASYYYFGDNNVPDYGFPYIFGKPADVDRRNFYGLIDRDFEQDQVHIGTFKVEHAIGDDVRLRNTLRYASYARHSIVSNLNTVGTPAPGTPLENIQVNPSGAQRKEHDSALINVTDGIFKFETWGFKHTLVSGIELGRETSDVTRRNFQNVPRLSLVNPDPRASLQGMTSAINFRGDTDAFSFGAFAVDELQLLNWLKIMGGVRYDLFDADFRNAFLGQTFSRTDTQWSPRAALIVQPTKQQTYYFSYGTSFNPSAENLSLAVNNADTAPETTASYEVGAKLDLLEGGALGITTALFRIDKNNARTTDPALGVMVLEGKQRVQGFELQIVGRLLPTWNILAGYTYLDSRTLEALEVTNGIPVKGKRIQNVPENTFSLWTTWDITPQWQVGGGTFYVSERFANNTNTNSAPGYVRADVTAAWRPLKPFEFRMNIQNLADTVFFEQVHPSHVIPGAGRTFLFTGTLSF
jgi:catecholate siderophore receptor